MRKIKKKNKPKEKKSENSEESHTDEKNVGSPKNNLPEKIRNAAQGLYYISETDAEIIPFVGKKTAAITKEEFLSQTKIPTDSVIGEKDFAEFFARLTEIQDWFGDEEKETAQKFVRLKELLERNLRDLKVFKVGKIQLDIYVVGLDAENSLLGIKTKAVET